MLCWLALNQPPCSKVLGDRSMHRHIIGLRSSLDVKGAFKIVASFFILVTQTFVYRYVFAPFHFPCLKNEQLLRYINPKSDS